MDAKDAIAHIRKALDEVLASGQQFVHVPTLLQFLFEVERDAPIASETRKLQHESNLTAYRAQHEASLEMFRSVLAAGKAALTASILVNGGASVALLAFLGNSWKANIGQPAQALVFAMVLFAAGVLAGAIASGLTYVTQFCYSREWARSGVGFHIGTIILVAISYVLFACGIVTAYHAFL